MLKPIVAIGVGQHEVGELFGGGVEPDLFVASLIRHELGPVRQSEGVVVGGRLWRRTREAEGRSEQIEFNQPPRADLEKAEVEGDLAKLTVRFLAEFRSRSKGPEGEAVDDKRTAELWTFQRNLKSRDPNWTLIHVDAAEA